MRKALLLLPLLAMGVTACGQKAKNEALEANETMGGDSNTMAEAEADTNAALAAGGYNDMYAGDTGNGSVAPAGNDSGTEEFD
jgi:hypothetical protein